MAFNSSRNGESQKKKWVAIITSIALAFFVVGLAGTSIVSFFQTMQAFLPLNDPTILMGGIRLGDAIAFLFAAIFQYGQNAALFIKKNYCYEPKIVLDLGIFDITDARLCDIAFGVCAAIDAGTNCLWLSKQGDVASQAWYFKWLEYAAMILIVFVEEVLGIAIQSLSHSLTELKKIRLHDRSHGQGQGKSDDRRGVGDGREIQRPISQQFRERLPQGSNQPKPMFQPNMSRSENKTAPPVAPKPLYNEPTYHPIHLNSDEG